MSDQDDLEPIFIPALSTLLLTAEDAKGEPLSEEEVFNIRDNAITKMMDREAALKMSETSDYKDIDPENCWYDWQMLRRELDRIPDLDPGVRYAFVDHDDGEYKKTIAAAQESLAEFKMMLRSKTNDDAFPLVKVLLAEPGFESYIWLQVVDVRDAQFEAEIFELPVEYKEYVVGDLVELEDSDIQDWMLNDKGSLYGGFSIRYSRENMSESEKVSFDEHIGVEKYI